MNIGNLVKTVVYEPVELDAEVPAEPVETEEVETPQEESVVSPV